MLINFPDRITAGRLKDKLQRPENRLIDPDEQFLSWLFRTPAAGIAAFSDATPYEDQDIPFADCETWILYRTAEDKVRRRPVRTVTGETQTTRIVNMAPSAIEGNKFIGATKYGGGQFLATYDPCS